MSTAKVFVGSLPPGCKPEELRHLFSNYGSVVECDIMNRCGFVHMETVKMAEAAITGLNGLDFKGQTIVVEPGRPKDRRSGGGGGGAVGGGAGNRRPMQGHGGGNFNRGGHSGGNNMRGGGVGRAQNSNDSHYGPMRSESNFRQQRSAPYNKGSGQHNQKFDAPSSQPFRNKFSQGMGNTGHSDYYAGNSGAGSSGNHHRGNSSSSSSHNIGQDRRGFALPAVEHQQQQPVSFGAKQNRFASGPIDHDNGPYQRNRNNIGMNSSNSQGSRGGFSPGRGGGFGGRGGGGGFSGRRGGGGSGQSNSMSHSHGGGFNKHETANGHNHHNAPNAYQTDFPPLGHSRGSGRGGGGGAPGNYNKFNGPRPAQNASGNRRF